MFNSGLDPDLHDHLVLSNDAKNLRCVRLLLNPYKRRESKLQPGGLLAQFGDVTKKHILDIIRQTGSEQERSTDRIVEEADDGIFNAAFTNGDDSGNGSRQNLSTSTTQFIEEPLSELQAKKSSS